MAKDREKVEEKIEKGRKDRKIFQLHFVLNILFRLQGKFMHSFHASLFLAHGTNTVRFYY